MFTSTKAKRVGVAAVFALALVLGSLSAFGAVKADNPIFLTRIGAIITTYPRNNALSIGTTTPNTSATSTQSSVAKLSVWGIAGDPWGKVFEVGTTSSSLLVVSNAGNVGIGTSTPGKLLDVFSAGTTTVRIDTSSATKGTCLVMKSNANTYFYFIVSNTTGTWATTTSSNCL